MNSRKLNQYFQINSSLNSRHYKDIILFLENQEKCRQEWNKCEKLMNELKNENIPLKEQNKSLKVQLELSRGQLKKAINEKNVNDQRTQALEQQLQTINALINESNLTDINGLDKNHLLSMTKTNFPELNSSLPRAHTSVVFGRKSFLPSDMEDSEGENTMHLARAASTVKNCPIFNKQPNQTEKQNTTRNIHDNSFEPAVIGMSPERNTNHSTLKHFVVDTTDVSAIIATETDTSMNVKPSVPMWEEHVAFQTSSLNCSLYPDVSECLQSQPIPVSTITSKPHNFIQKKEIKPGKCSACLKSIGFKKAFYRCQDCHIKCHVDCKQFINTACTTNTDDIQINDVVSGKYSVKVPDFVIECIKEIEKRGLGEQGLYRVCGSVKLLDELISKLKNNLIVDVTKISSIHTLTGLLKHFFRALSEPIITRQAHAAFLECGNKNDLPKLNKLIEALPAVNKETLAFVMIHLRKVARVQENLMDFRGIARSIGTSIIGHGALNPTSAQIVRETEKQPMLMENILGISEDHWESILGVNDVSTIYRRLNNPNNTAHNAFDASVAESSLMLGSIEVDNDLSFPVGRNKRKSNALTAKKEKIRYFESPVSRI